LTVWGKKSGFAVHGEEQNGFSKREKCSTSPGEFVPSVCYNLWSKLLTRIELTISFNRNNIMASNSHVIIRGVEFYTPSSTPHTKYTGITSEAQALSTWQSFSSSDHSIVGSYELSTGFMYMKASHAVDGKVKLNGDVTSFLWGDNAVPPPPTKQYAVHPNTSLNISVSVTTTFGVSTAAAAFAQWKAAFDANPALDAGVYVQAAGLLIIGSLIGASASSNSASIAFTGGNTTP